MMLSKQENKNSPNSLMSKIKINKYQSNNNRDTSIISPIIETIQRKGHERNLTVDTQKSFESIIDLIDDDTSIITIRTK